MAKITKNDKLETALNSVIEKVENAGNWIKPFKSAIQNGMPINVKGNEYKGINVFILWLKAIEMGYTQNRWVTYKGALEMNCQVKKGEKSTTIFFYKPILVDDKDKDDGSKKTIFMLNAYNVFNIEQTDKVIEVVETETNENEVIENAKEFFDNLDYLEVKKHPQPHYNASDDTIGMPSINDFVSADEYYSTLSHEYIHSTLHTDRCNRKDNDRKSKDENYAFEELVAEIGSIFVMARLGLDSEPIQDNSSAYLKSWLKALKDDKKILWKASSQAYKAFEFLDSYQYENEVENEEAQTTLETA